MLDRQLVQKCRTSSNGLCLEVASDAQQEHQHPPRHLHTHSGAILDYRCKVLAQEHKLLRRHLHTLQVRFIDNKCASLAQKGQQLPVQRLRRLSALDDALPPLPEQ